MLPERMLTWTEVYRLPVGEKLRHARSFPPNTTTELLNPLRDMFYDVITFYFKDEGGLSWSRSVAARDLNDFSGFFALESAKSVHCECGSLKCGGTAHSTWCPLYQQY